MAQKGEKQSEETKQKISESEKGKIISDETRINMRNGQLGRKQTPEHIENARRTRIGRKLSEETRKKISNSHKGNNSYMWKGGISPENKIIRKSIQFKLWRESVFKRDNWICQKCKKGGQLHPHHILNFAQKIELRFDVNNGITLCVKCHSYFHKLYGIKNNTEAQIKEYLHNKLTTMYEQNVREDWKNYKKVGMYEFMKSLGC